LDFHRSTPGFSLSFDVFAPSFQRNPLIATYFFSKCFSIWVHKNTGRERGGASPLESCGYNGGNAVVYGIGICSVEELGTQPFPVDPPQERRADPPNGNGRAAGQPRLRDKLCLLICKYELDPTLVKCYAADFCGTEALRDASRDLVEAFVSTLAEEAAKDRAALVCKLNSYNQLAEVKL
jgi:hypothetical protein